MKVIVLALILSVIFTFSNKDEAIDTPDTEQQDAREIVLSAKIYEAISDIILN